jgi:hypothetical protein
MYICVKFQFVMYLVHRDKKFVTTFLPCSSVLGTKVIDSQCPMANVDFCGVLRLKPTLCSVPQQNFLFFFHQSAINLHSVLLLLVSCSLSSSNCVIVHFRSCQELDFILSFRNPM